MSADIEAWPPPGDANAFESLCLDLWKEIWNDPGAQKNGRSGQPQAGIDVFGLRDGKQMGVQCKQKNGLLRTKVTVAELDREVKEAQNFRPALNTFILATTGPRDAHTQERARLLSEENQGKGLFNVEVWSWNDIWHELYQHEELLKRVGPIYWPRRSAELRASDAIPRPPFWKRPWFKATITVAGLVALSSIFDLQNIFERVRTKVTKSATDKPSAHIDWLPPELPEGCKTVTVYFGDMGIELRTNGGNLTWKKEFEVKALKERSEWLVNPYPASTYATYFVDKFITARIITNRLYASVRINAGPDFTILITHGHIGKIPEGWDMNTNAVTLEIVDKRLDPVYQIDYRYRQDLAEVFIYGALVSANDVFATRRLPHFPVRTNANCRPSDIGLDTWFKYPSKDHPGELAD